MPQRIIVGYVDTRAGQDALALGSALADLDPDSTLTVAHVYDHDRAGEALTPADGLDRANRELRAARETVGTRAGTDVVPYWGLSPADGLHRLADERKATLLVVGVSHRHGLGRILPGSATEQTLHGAPCGVAVAPSGYSRNRIEQQGIRVVVAAYDSSPESEVALDVASRFAGAAGARLRIVDVVEQAVLWYGGYMGPGAARDARDYLREALDRAAHHAAAVPGIGVVETRMLDGDPARMLRDVAAETDLLVVGSRDHGPLQRVMLGSVSSRLAHEPPCPLVVLPRTAHEGRTGQPSPAENEHATPAS